MKAERAGFAGRLDKGVRERDAHIQMRKPGPRRLRNLIWVLSPSWQAVCNQGTYPAAGHPEEGAAYFFFYIYIL